MNFDVLDRAKGALVGLAIGDALGATMEFQPRPLVARVTDIIGGGPFELEPGQWTDDTAMMLCLADSLIEWGESNPHDQMQRYLAWRDAGHNSCTGNNFAMGKTVYKALHRYEQNHIPLAGNQAEESAGNGSLMRIAPVALLTYRDSLSDSLLISSEASCTTHAERRCIDACWYMTYLLYTLLNCKKAPEKRELLFSLSQEFQVFTQQMHQESLEIIAGSYIDKPRHRIRSSGFVLDSLEAALWCFWKSDSFKDGAILAANLGDDADTVAAIYGQLAGAYYGYNGLPTSWLNKLSWHEVICLKASLLVSRKDPTK